MSAPAAARSSDFGRGTTSPRRALDRQSVVAPDRCAVNRGRSRPRACATRDICHWARGRWSVSSANLAVFEPNGGSMKRYLAFIPAISIVLSGCASEGSASGSRPMTNMETGTIIGAVGGAVVGAVAYKKDRTKGAVIGAVGGGLAGGAASEFMASPMRDPQPNIRGDTPPGNAR